jgi:RimJ/RimL family protein N-acetyltransferase
MNIVFEKYNKKYLEKSWIWLNDSEIKKLTMTPDFTQENQKQWFNSLKEKKDYLIWGIMVDNVPVGVCGLKNITEEKAEYWGYIGEKKYWGKGIGKTMMNMTIDKAKELRLQKINLKVLNNNYRAIKLYDYFGFKVTDNENNILIMTFDLDNI